MQILANIVDIRARRIYFGELVVKNGKIDSIRETGEERTESPYLMPGFIDAHVHVESSMLVPSEFARLAVCHGTVATVSDPHEIANVLGIEGVDFMLENASRVPFRFFFGAPSCVPATTFETAGATIDSEGIRSLLEREEILYLAEMMNFPGVLFGDEEVMKKLAIARELGKPVDGHAPGLSGEDAVKYIGHGISTDHECVSYEEALWKLENGMKIIIREGSAAKNFAALIDLIDDWPEMLMFCSDDKHPDDLEVGHINKLAARAIGLGKDLFDVLRATCLNPIGHYGLPVGSLRVGDPADCILVSDLRNFEVLHCLIDGKPVSLNGSTHIESVRAGTPNNFNCAELKPDSFAIQGKGGPVRIIRAIDGALVTEEMVELLEAEDGLLQPNVKRDILKLSVINRYTQAEPACAFIQGFGLKEGALASSVGHDSHNILVVGTDDSAMARAANAVIRSRGGIAAVRGEEERLLPLPVGGIMSNEDGYTVARLYSEIDRFAREEMGSTLTSPFMTLSFMALLVIPKLKLSDKGLFDGKEFTFVSLETEG